MLRLLLLLLLLLPKPVTLVRCDGVVRRTKGAGRTAFFSLLLAFFSVDFFSLDFFSRTADSLPDLRREWCFFSAVRGESCGGVVVPWVRTGGGRD